MSAIIAPDDQYTRRARAQARLEAGKFTGAAEDFARAIVLQPEFVQHYLARAAVYGRLGQAAPA